MKRLIASLAVLAVLLVAGTAQAATDLGNGACEQTDGQIGVWDGTEAADEGCVTAEEYAARFSVDNLIEEGVLVDPVDNGDGTVTGTAWSGVPVTVKDDALDRPVAATPRLEPDAPTVREVLFPTARHFPI